MLSGRDEAGNPQRAASVVPLEKRRTREVDDPAGVAGLRRRRVGRADDETVGGGEDGEARAILSAKGGGTRQPVPRGRQRGAEIVLAVVVLGQGGAKDCRLGR